MSEEVLLPELPQNWMTTTLGDIRNETSETVNPANFTDEVFELFSIPSLESGQAEVVKGAEIGSTKKTVEEGVVLISKINPRINRVWIVSPRKEFRQIASTEWIAFFPSDYVDAKYLAYFLQQEAVRSYLSLNVSGVGGSLTRTNAQTLGKYTFSLAPLNEQKRIVEKLEQLLSELDKAVDALKAAQQKLKTYRRAVLKAAVEGELSRAWREENGAGLEPADELLRRILAERRRKWEETELEKMRAKGKEPKDDKWKEKYKEPVEPDSSELPQLPVGWCWASPEQLSSSDSYSLAIGPFGSNLKVSDYAAEGVPLIFVRNIRSAQFNKLDGKFVSEAKAEELRAHQVRGGDILITKMGDPPGDACVYPEALRNAVITADCIKWSLNSALPARALFSHFVASNVVHKQILERTRGVAQLKISLARFKDVAVPLLPLSEQTYLLNHLRNSAKGVNGLN